MRRTQSERLAAWLVTGPPGHLWSALAELAIAWSRYVVSRLFGPLTRARRG